MTPIESDPSQNLPTVSVDVHFANVPRLAEVSFDIERCVELFEAIGVMAADMSRIHIHLRPDYKLAYSKAERAQLKAADPEEYDTESASCDPIKKAGPLGEKGDVLITIVYGTHYGTNALMCHEGVHAREMLKPLNLLTAIYRAVVLSSKTQARIDDAEEAEADRAMKDPDLKMLRKGIIKVVRHKKSTKHTKKQESPARPITSE